MKKRIAILENFFLDRDGVKPADYGFTIKLENGTTVQNVGGTYVENEHDDAISFEDMTDSELEELELLKEAIEVDDEKTAKRIS